MTAAARSHTAIPGASPAGWPALAGLCLAALVAFLGQFALNPFLPAIAADLGVGVTLLGVANGIRAAVRAAGPGLGSIRLDSGDLGSLAVQARNLLDSA